MDEPIIIRHETVGGNGTLTLIAELDNGELVEIGEAFDDEEDECEALAYVGRACTGLTAEAAKRNLDARRAELIRASAVIR